MSHWYHVTGRERHDAVPAVWDMVQATYAKIGLIVDSPHELDEYNHWELFGDHDVWVAFVLSKTTPYGLKLGLAGSDGSRAGRTAVKDYVTSSFFAIGHYAEVSHRMEELAFDAGAPLVCAAYASDVLNKDVDPARDGVHYRRAIKGVGEVTKVIVGRPRGIPVTPSDRPSCPVPDRSMRGRRKLAADHSTDAVFAHAMSIVKL